MKEEIVETNRKSFSENDAQQQENDQDQMEISWEEIFDGLPTAPGSEAAQERHKQLREQDDMTEEEEREFNALFYEIYPQFRLKALKRRQLDSQKQDTTVLTMLVIEFSWCGITLLHCGMTGYGLVGCLICSLCCWMITHLALQKE